MAYVGDWGTFIHIPKCGGFGFRQFLTDQMGKGVEVGPYHGLPETIDRGFTMVRNPVDWLRSIWAYRNNNDWLYKSNSRQYWSVIMGLTQYAEGMPWDVFVEWLDRDIVSTIYGMYQHPSVKIYKMEDAHQLLFDLEIDTELPVTHVTPFKPKVTRAQRDRLERVCWRSMVDYGYAKLNDTSPIAEIADLRRLLVDDGERITASTRAYRRG